MENRNEFRALNREELEEAWEMVFSDVFTRFEDFVAEVRKIESQMQAEWITQVELLKAANYRRRHIR
ncbi:MAG: hypothetical protein HOI47_01375 [Candidatus Scalindua sp.]|jgi:hypothetical protein|nr:hypothetical protein [Candidatus Scalindua sp.]MBT6225285.1 hypothetical protein [Candidatus Scalindua sp.]